jgi:hypothetical protein
MDEQQRYWFAAKKTGLGWGWPSTWQGWAVYAIAIASYLLAFPFFNERGRPIRSILITIAVAIAVFGICYWKGDPAGRSYRSR